MGAKHSTNCLGAAVVILTMIATGTTWALLAEWRSRPDPTQQVEQRQAGKHAPEENAEKPGDPFVGALTNIAGELKALNADPYAKQERKNAAYDLSAQNRMADAAWAMIIIAFVQLAIGIIGLITLFRTLAQGRDAVEEARKGAEAAQASVAVARENARRELRAYLSVGGLRVENFLADHRPTYYYGLKNRGATPAKRVIIVAGLFRVHNNARLRVDLKDEPKIPLELGAGQSHEIDFQPANKVSHQDLADMASERLAIVLCGYVIYRDVFQVTRRIVFRGTVDLTHLRAGNGALGVTARSIRST